MRKGDKKGFTLIELLAVIVILAILVAVAIPAVTRYLNQARRGTFANDASTMIEAVRNEYLTSMSTPKTIYNKAAVNELLEKKLKKSPFGAEYSDDSYVQVKKDTNGNITYHVCLSDDSNNMIDADEGAVSDTLKNGACSIPAS